MSIKVIQNYTIDDIKNGISYLLEKASYDPGVRDLINDRIKELYCNCGLSVSDIAIILSNTKNYSRSSIYNKLKPIMRNHSQAAKTAITQGKIASKRIGRISPRKGKHYKNIPNDIREKIVEFYNDGHSLGETKLEFKNYCGGYTISNILKEAEVYIRSVSESKKMQFRRGFADYYLRGNNHPFWTGGESNFPYSIEFNNQLKELIRNRDGYQCQSCGVPECELDRKLDVHHIDYNKENCLPTNLISLCRSCNVKANTNREYWQNCFNGIMETDHPLKLGEKNVNCSSELYT